MITSHSGTGRLADSQVVDYCRPKRLRTTVAQIKLELDASWKWGLACSVGLQSYMQCYTTDDSREYNT